MLFLILGTVALSMDGVDFYCYELLKILAILGILRIMATFGREGILGGRNSFLLSFTNRNLLIERLFVLY